jgi:hypothetical protein
VATSPLVISPLHCRGLGIEEVETTPTIHEDTRQVGLADDWVDDKGKMSWLQNVVRVILFVESDHSL